MFSRLKRISKINRVIVAVLGAILFWRAFVFRTSRAVEDDRPCDEARLQNCSEPTIFGRFSFKGSKPESLCSRKSSRRGLGQKVVAFSLFVSINDPDGELSWYGKVIDC